MITLICGMTPLASVFCRKMSAYPARLSTPSWMRAPPASNRPMIGAPLVRAIFWILTILAACAPDSEPPKTVKSLEKT